MTIFEVTPSWRASHPGSAAGILLMDGLENSPRPPALQAKQSELETRLRERFAGRDISSLAELPQVQAYNAYLKPFKKSYHVQMQLASIIFQGKSIPGELGLVQAMFLAELENGLLTAGHDLDALHLPVRLDVATGQEVYTLLRGQDQQTKAGDMLMADGEGIISTIVYGPDARSRLHLGSRAALFAVYAPPGITSTELRLHLECLRDNVILFSPQAQVQLLEIYAADSGLQA